MIYEKETALNVCRQIVQNAKCNNERFVRISSYYSYLESAYNAYLMREKEYNSLEDYDSEESKELYEKMLLDKRRINQYIAIIAIESAL